MAFPPAVVVEHLHLVAGLEFLVAIWWRKWSEMVKTNNCDLNRITMVLDQESVGVIAADDGA